MNTKKWGLLCLLLFFWQHIYMFTILYDLGKRKMKYAKKNKYLNAMSELVNSFFFFI